MGAEKLPAHLEVVWIDASFQSVETQYFVSFFSFQDGCQESYTNSTSAFPATQELNMCTLGILQDIKGLILFFALCRAHSMLFHVSTEPCPSSRTWPWGDTRCSHGGDLYEVFKAEPSGCKGRVQA